MGIALVLAFAFAYVCYQEALTKNLNERFWAVLGFFLEYLH